MLKGFALQRNYFTSLTCRGRKRQALRTHIRCLTAMASARKVRDSNVAVVGSSRGIGLEFVRQLLARDNTVHATARHPEDSKGLQELQAEYDRLTLATLDTGDEASVKAWAELLKGEKRFDYVFNIAGVADFNRATISTIDSERMMRCFRVNTIGPLLVVKHLLESKLLGKGSLVANMTSKMGSIADNSSGHSYAYRASKAGLNQVTKSMSIDLEDEGITCVLIHPGWVRTDMTRGNGLIDVDQSVSGLLSVLESDLPLNGHMYDYKHDEIPW